MELFNLEDENLNQLRDDMFSESVKTMIATNIYVACNMSKDLRDSLIYMPMRAGWFAGHALGFFIDKLMTEEIDNSVVGRFPYNYRETRIPKCGYPYVEYYSANGKFHIKKMDKPEKLPKAAVHRVSNALVNKFFLDFGPEYIPDGVNVPFGLITYGHKKFDLTFISLGFPTWDYSGWANHWEITDNISKERAETIMTHKAPELKEEYQEQIVKKYELKLKGD